MNDFTAIDLHMHTNVSDGTDTPEALLHHVREAGLDLFSVTDHDSFRACLAISELRTEQDPVFLSGVEFSCRDQEGKYHILGYGFDPNAESICQIVKTGHQYRMNKVLARLDFLDKTFGFSFSPEDLQHLLALDNPGKPHIGNLMVQYGYAETKEQAINKYINQIRFQDEYILPQEAITSILAAGGIPVLAHPVYGSGDQLILGDDMDQRLRKLIDYGLEGVEAFYSGFTEKLCRQMLGFAEQYDLYITAGSDYHGANKLISLGDTGLESVEQRPKGLLKFLETIGERSA